MEHTIKLPKNLKAHLLCSRDVPEEGSWQNITSKKFINICRARDKSDSESAMNSYWTVGLFAGGEVKLGKLQYRILSIDTSNDKPSYSDDYTIAYDEAELVSIPCIYFDEDTKCFKGEVIGFFKDGDCAVVKDGDMQVIKLDPSKVKYISDILDME